MASSDKGIEIPEGNPVREYSPEEARQLTENLRELLRGIRAGQFADRRIDSALVQDFHAAVFGGIRGFAGRLRSRSFGSEYLTFGPHRSMHRNAVPDALEKVARHAARRLEEALSGPVTLEQTDVLLRTALHFHNDLIRIHPFEDGNGRTARAFLSLFLVRAGLPPIAFEVPRQEYLDSLNTYFLTRDEEPLMSLVLELLAR